jgi:hypothetical protein
MPTFLTVNTRQAEWKESLRAQVENKVTYLVEPDKVVLDFLKDMQHDFTLVDPQHFGGVNAVSYKGPLFTSAIQMAGNMYVNNEADTVFIGGFKVDLDMLGAMALLSQEGPFVSERIDTVDAVDNGTFFGEWNPQSVDNNTLLLTEVEVADTKILGAMAADFKTPLADKVAMMATWLAGGEVPQQFKAELLKERELLLQATTQILSGIKVITCESAGVSSLIYQDTEVAGKGMPFGIAFNPKFRGQGSKFSILQFKNKYLDAPNLFIRLNELEQCGETWGGNPTLGIGGSPLNTTLSPEVVASELVNFLTDKGKEYLQ